MHDIVDPDFVGDKLFFFFIYRYVLSIFMMMSSQEKRKRNCFIWHIKLEWNNILCVHWWNRQLTSSFICFTLSIHLYCHIYAFFYILKFSCKKKNYRYWRFFFLSFFLIKINISIMNAIPYSWFSLIIENYRKFFSEKTPQC